MLAVYSQNCPRYHYVIGIDKQSLLQGAATRTRISLQIRSKTFPKIAPGEAPPRRLEIPVWTPILVCVLQL